MHLLHWGPVHTCTDIMVKRFFSMCFGTFLPHIKAIRYLLKNSIQDKDFNKMKILSGNVKSVHSNLRFSCQVVCFVLLFVWFWWASISTHSALDHYLLICHAPDSVRHWFLCSSLPKGKLCITETHQQLSSPLMRMAWGGLWECQHPCASTDFWGDNLKKQMWRDTDSS